MNNLKDAILNNLKNSLEFCKNLEDLENDSEKESYCVAYSFTSMISATLVDKYSKLVTDEEKHIFFTDLENALDAEAKELDELSFRFSGKKVEA